jgi:hypothetical protein
LTLWRDSELATDESNLRRSNGRLLPPSEGMKTVYPSLKSREIEDEQRLSLCDEVAVAALISFVHVGAHQRLKGVYLGRKSRFTVPTILSKTDL